MDRGNEPEWGAEAGKFILKKMGWLPFPPAVYVNGQFRLPRDRKRVLEIFEMYKFEDEYGHPLTNCVDFLQLVDAFCAGSGGEAE